MCRYIRMRSEEVTRTGECWPEFQKCIQLSTSQPLHNRQGTQTSGSSKKPVADCKRSMGLSPGWVLSVDSLRAVPLCVAGGGGGTGQGASSSYTSRCATRSSSPVWRGKWRRRTPTPESVHARCPPTNASGERPRSIQPAIRQPVAIVRLATFYTRARRYGPVTR